MCWGSCCPLVNCTLNTLVKVGELNEDAEVSVYFIYFCIILLYRIYVLP